MEYYVFATKADADTCLGFINTTSWFPVVGSVNGVPAPQNQKTEKWADEPTEMLSGEWCIPRIPESRLDYLGVSAESRATFLAAFGQDIRTLTHADFPVPEEVPSPPEA